MPINLWLFLWSFVLLGGIGTFLNYEFTPGLKKETPSQWPKDTKIQRVYDFQLIAFFHPFCPCSQASLDELQHLLKTRNFHTSILIATYDQHSPIWKKAQSLNAFICEDPNGDEAKRFGAMTSGHICLYDPAGRLIFSGGITPSRGHRGDNPGKQSILSATAGQSMLTTPVFGCPIYDD